MKLNGSLSLSLSAPSSSSFSSVFAAAFPTSKLHLNSSSSSSLSCFTHKLQRTSFLWAWRPGREKHGSNNKNQRQQQLRKAGMARSYMEQPKNPLVEFLSKVQGGLPVVGLLSRILSDEGGIGGDRIQFVEFCGRVEKACSSEASRAFFAFQERHGTVARPQYVLIWCWAAAVGAGLLKSEEIMLGALRLRVSYDIQYEIESFNLLMDTAAKRREKSRSPIPDVPIIARAEKSLDAICKCCIGPSPITDEDVNLLSIILSTVFPTVNKTEIQHILRSKSRDTSKNLVQGESIKMKDKEEMVEDSSSSMAR